MGAQMLHQVKPDRIAAERDDDVGVAEGHHVHLARALALAGDDRVGQLLVREQVAGRGIDVDDVGQARERRTGNIVEVFGQARSQVDELDAGRQQDDGGAVGLEASAVLRDGDQHLPQGAGPALRGARDVKRGRGLGAPVYSVFSVDRHLRGGQADEVVLAAGVQGRGQDEGVLTVECESGQIHQQRVDGADECETVHGTSQLTVVRIICI